MSQLTHHIVGTESFEFCADVARSLIGHRIPFRYSGEDGENFYIHVSPKDKRIAEDVAGRVAFTWAEMARQSGAENNPTSSTAVSGESASRSAYSADTNGGATAIPDQCSLDPDTATPFTSPASTATSTCRIEPIISQRNCLNCGGMGGFRVSAINCPGVVMERCPACLGTGKAQQ